MNRRCTINISTEIRWQSFPLLLTTWCVVVTASLNLLNRKGKFRGLNNKLEFISKYTISIIIKIPSSGF